MILAIALFLFSTTPAAQLQAVAPLREVVYKVSSLRTQALSIETYGGSVANDLPEGNGGATTISHEPQPTAQRTAVLEDGTLTIDVVGIEQNVIRVSITENFKNRPTARTYAAYVAANGLVRFDNEDPSPIARFLLPLFGTNFAATETFNTGDSWHVDLKTTAVDVQNVFTITGQDGALLLLDEHETVKLNSARGMNYIGTGKIKYKPSLLVPIVGDIEEHGARSTMDSVNEMRTTVHFERISDTRDTTPTPTAAK
jgi:hypothetical protein